MDALVDRLSAELTSTYVQYLETFLVDTSIQAGLIEFRCGFSLRRDHKLRQFTLEIPEMSHETDGERELVVVAIFDEIEELIDKAIAERGTATN